MCVMLHFYTVGWFYNNQTLFLLNAPASGILSAKEVMLLLVGLSVSISTGPFFTDIHGGEYYRPRKN